MRILLLFIFQVTASIAILIALNTVENIPKGYDASLQILLGGFLTSLGLKVYNSKEYLRIAFKLISLTVQGKALRISFASLIRIKVDNKYLLVKSKRNSLFQPPGGVLRFYDKNIKTQFHLIDDVSYQILKDDEFRLRFPAGKLWHVFSFLKWFESQLGREIDPHREFHEELIDTKILDPVKFSKPQFSYVKRIIPPIKWGSHFQVDELFLFEIFEIVLSDVQKQFIIDLQKTTNSEYAFLSANEINKNGFNGSVTTQIGGHTKHILS